MTGVLLFLLLSFPVWGIAQSLTGSMGGVISDVQAGVLPGVTVTLTGRSGSRSTVTDGRGAYYFQAVDPGTYTLIAELSGFQTFREEQIVLTLGATLTLDRQIAVVGLAETIRVVAQSPIVASTSSQTSQGLSQDILFNLPILRTNAAVNLLNNVPGITDGSAFGGGADSGNALLLDGVDTRDPDGGTAWTYFNYNIVQEVEVKGVGAPAEYGAFTGAVVNFLSKSGGNLYSGLFDLTYTGAGLSSDNIDAALIADNAALGQPDVSRKLIDVTTQLGGPLVRDKAFFYLSGQRFMRDQDPAGPRTIRREVSPRLNLKVTLQPRAADQLTLTVQSDDYNVIGRAPTDLDYVVPDAVTNRQDSPELVGLIQWRRLFGSRTFLEAKYTGYQGYFDLTPEVNAPGHLDAVTGEYSVSQGWLAMYDRHRNQANLSIVHYRSWLGEHELKVGAEFERSGIRNRFEYVDDIFYEDSDGMPFLAYRYREDVTARNRRESVYAQDAWRIARVTVNAGARLDWIRGGSPDAPAVYDVLNLQPRIGVAFDPVGHDNTVVRAHYGRYHEAAFASLYSRGLQGIGDLVVLEHDGSQYREVERIASSVYEVDKNIRHPRVDELTFGVEHALTDGIRFQATGIFRANQDLVDSVVPDARWERVGLPNSLTAGILDAYRWVNPNHSQANGRITNPDGFVYRDLAGNVLGTARAFRRYRAVMFALNRRFSRRWQGSASYVLAKSTGTVDNTAAANDGATRVFENPSLALVNREGPLRNDRRHELKVHLTHRLPRIDVFLSAIWHSYSGRTWTPFQPYSIDDTGFALAADGRDFYVESRGARRMPPSHSLDLRLERPFRIAAQDRLSVYLDVANTLNADSILDYQDRAPSRTITGIGAIAVGAPLSVLPPRQLTVGARWSF